MRTKEDQVRTNETMLTEICIVQQLRSAQDEMSNDAFCELIRGLPRAEGWIRVWETLISSAQMDLPFHFTEGGGDDIFAATSLWTGFRVV